MKNLNVSAISVAGRSYHPHVSSPIVLGKAGTVSTVIEVIRFLFGNQTHTDRFQFVLGQSLFSLESSECKISIYGALGFFVECSVEYMRPKTSEYWSKSEFLG